MFSPIERTVNTWNCMVNQILKFWQRFWLEHQRISLQFIYCGNVLFTSWFISAFSLSQINTLCKCSSSLLEAGRCFFASLIFFLTRCTCVENVGLLMNWVVHKLTLKLQKSLLNLIFARTVVSHLNNNHPTHFTFPFTDIFKFKECWEYRTLIEDM